MHSIPKAPKACRTGLEKGLVDDTVDGFAQTKGHAEKWVHLVDIDGHVGYFELVFFVKSQRMRAIRRFFTQNTARLGRDLDPALKTLGWKPIDNEGVVMRRKA